MLKRNMVVLFIVVISAITLSCKDSIGTASYGDSNSQHRILVTGTTSDFKLGILEEIVGRYAGTCYIRFIPYRDIDLDSISDYSAILIMDECQAWMVFNGKVKRLVDKIERKERITLLLTAGDPDWEYSRNGVDAVTSASVEDSRDGVVHEIISSIDGLVGLSE